MVDDIRRPRQEEDEVQNKQETTEANPVPDLDAPHLYGQEDGFVSAKASKKIRQIRWPHLMFKHASKKQKIIGCIIAVVLLIGGGAGVYALHKSLNKEKAEAPVVQAAKPVKTTEPSKLTGVEVNPEINKKPVTSIQIENSPDARPQAGLKDAGVIYEAIAEGGITRFNASFLEGQPDYIGPIRSVRPYYAVLVAPFDPIFVHAGGSAQGLDKLRELGLKDFDHGANGGAFRRVSDRYAPHNLYSSMADLDKASAGRGYNTSDVKSFARKQDKPAAAVTARAIDIPISSALYNVHYDYDQPSNSYKRVMGGQPHTDHRSGQQLAPKTVVALAMDFSQQGVYSVYQTTGSGKAFIFQDGVVQTGTWKKTGDKDQFVFTDDAGKPIELNAGQTWITLIKAPGSVTYVP